jgi:hypothetical protein
MAYEQGGGGGKSPSITAVSAHALSKPYDLIGDMTPEKVAQLDEMLELLFRSTRFSADDLSDLETTVNNLSSGGGDVFGPDVAVDDNLVLFDGVTGKRIKDSGVSVDDLATVTGLTARSVRVPLTELALEGANTTPIELVAATSGKILIPMSCAIELNQTAVYSNNPTISIRYGGIAGNLTNTAAGAFNVGGSHSERHIISIVDTLTIASDIVNKSLVFFLNADLTGTGSVTGTAVLAYYIVDEF